jgi:hypothetical protein
MDPDGYAEKMLIDEGDHKSHMQERRPRYDFAIPAMTEEFRAYLRSELPKFTNEHPDAVICAIEELAMQNLPNPREAMIMALEPALGDMARYFVNRLAGYKKKPCRMGASCRRGASCFFSHERDGGEGGYSQWQRPEHMERERSLRGLVDKQRKILDTMERAGLSEDIQALVDRAKRMNAAMRAYATGRSPEMGERSLRFVIAKRKEWMTDEHLGTYPGVVRILHGGVVECGTREDAERIFNMIKQGDPSADLSWLEQ